MSLDGDPTKLAAYYAKWAETYDADVGDDDYGLPGSVLVTIAKATSHVPWLDDRSITCLDAGCGTGRVGIALAAAGYRQIDGVDLSPEMAALALERRRVDGSAVYREVEAPIDLTAEVPCGWKHAADLVIVGGVFTIGHIAPHALWRVADYVRPGGVLITTVRPGYYDTTAYGQVSEEFSSGDRAELLVEFDDLPYTADSHGRYFAYLVN